MATARPCLGQLSRACLNLSRSPPINTSTRPFSTSSVRAVRASWDKITSKKIAPNGANSGAASAAKKKKLEEQKKKKKPSMTFKQYDLRKEETFSLLDAMRYIRAWEVGQKPATIKYEMHVKLKTMKNGPAVRNRIRLPHPVKTDFKVCVICPPDSKWAEDARAAGAILVGEDDVFDAVKDGIIEFDRCICQTGSLAKMNKAGLGRILGPRGLMPSSKLGTVVVDPAKTMKAMSGASEYRERQGVVRMAVGQLGFTPEELSRNIKALIESIKKDASNISDLTTKDVAEVVLSSTNGPGFPLSGVFQSSNSNITARELSGL